MYAYQDFVALFRKPPQAMAEVKGSEAYPSIKGEVRFYNTQSGVLVFARIWGLPDFQDGCVKPIFGFHIHGGTSCSGNANDPFANTLMHYNPKNCPHPYHAGDLPPLFGNNGYALSAVLINRFTIEEIIGRTVLIHAHPDDFTTQPAGNSGTKIACGEIQRVRNYPVV